MTYHSDASTTATTATADNALGSMRSASPGAAA